MIDTELWLGILILTAILYGFKWIQSRRKHKVYRISPDSLQRSKKVMLQILPLVEDENEGPLDEVRLPYTKDHVKSAAKILAYYYHRENRPEELGRIKNCFVSLSRFQNRDTDPDLQEKRMEREKRRLTNELNGFLTRSPFSGGKAA